MGGKIEGGCLCGRIRYSVSRPLGTILCHCTHCQKCSGSAFSVNVIVSNDDFTITGETRRYLDTGDSGGHLDRHFCPDCGSSLFTIAESFQGVTILKAGTLDDTLWVKPETQIFRDSAQEWIPMLNELKTFARGMI